MLTIILTSILVIRGGGTFTLIGTTNRISIVSIQDKVNNVFFFY